MPAIHMSDEERDSLFLLAQSPAPAGVIPVEHATRFVALGLAVRETLRFRITLRGQVEILRQRFRKMPLSRVAKVSKKHFLATFEDRFSDRPLLGRRAAEPSGGDVARRNAPPSPPKPQQPRHTAPGGMPPPNPGLPPQRQSRPAPSPVAQAPARVVALPGQQARPPAGQQMRPQAGQQLRPQAGQQLRPQGGQQSRPQAGQQLRLQAGQQLRPQGGQQMRPQGGQPPRPASQPGKNPQLPQAKGPPPRKR